MRWRSRVTRNGTSFSSLVSLGKARIVQHALQRNTIEAVNFHDFLAPQVSSDQVADRLAGLRIYGGPAGDPIALVGFNRPAIIELHGGNPRANDLVRRALVVHAANPHHVTALLIVGIGVEQIV